MPGGRGCGNATVPRLRRCGLLSHSVIRFTSPRQGNDKPQESGTTPSRSHINHARAARKTSARRKKDEKKNNPCLGVGIRGKLLPIRCANKCTEREGEHLGFPAKAFAISLSFHFSFRFLTSLGRVSFFFPSSRSLSLFPPRSSVPGVCVKCIFPPVLQQPSFGTNGLWFSHPCIMYHAQVTF